MSVEVWHGGAAPRVGQSASRSRLVTRRDIELFTEISGDRNPLHYDDELAAATSFGGIVVQGGVTSAVLNAVVAEDLPARQRVPAAGLSFRAPVRPGDLITDGRGHLGPHRQADHRPGAAGHPRRRRGRRRGHGLCYLSSSPDDHRPARAHEEPGPATTCPLPAPSAAARRRRGGATRLAVC